MSTRSIQFPKRVNLEGINSTNHPSVSPKTSAHARVHANWKLGRTTTFIWMAICAFVKRHGFHSFNYSGGQSGSGERFVSYANAWNIG